MCEPDHGITVSESKQNSQRVQQIIDLRSVRVTMTEPWSRRRKHPQSKSSFDPMGTAFDYLWAAAKPSRRIPLPAGPSQRCGWNLLHCASWNACWIKAWSTTSSSFTATGRKTWPSSPVLPALSALRHLHGPSMFQAVGAPFAFPSRRLCRKRPFGSRKAEVICVSASGIPGGASLSSHRHETGNPWFFSFLFCGYQVTVSWLEQEGCGDGEEQRFLGFHGKKCGSTLNLSARDWILEPVRRLRPKPASGRFRHKITSKRVPDLSRKKGKPLL